MTSFRIRRHATRRPAAGWIRLLGVLALTILASTPGFAAPADQPALPCAEVIWNDVTDTPDTLRQCDLPPLTSGADPSGTARAFLAAHHTALGLSSGLEELKPVAVKHGLNSSHLTFQQTIDTLPVSGAYVTVHLGRNGAIQVVHYRLLPELRVDTTQTSVTAVEAVQQARQAIKFAAPRASSAAPEQIVLPESSTTGRVVWRVMVPAAEPQGDWEVLVDATTGKVVKRYNRLVMDRGQIFDPAPARQPGLLWRWAQTRPALRTEELEGLDGSGWLRGEYVDVTQPQGYRPAAAYSPGGDFRYGPDDPRFEEVMVYHYIDATQRYVQSLGYSNANTPPNGIRDRVTLVSPHWFEQDQSFYSVSDDSLHFGDGGMQDAEDPDVIVHEYAHALTHDQVPYWSGSGMEAVGEGFGDYLAASRFASTSDDPACIAEWDSRAYVPTAPYCLRRVDRDRQYPIDVTGNPHTDGEIWSRVLWDLRQTLGASTADTLALESNFYLPPAATLEDAGKALLDAEANLYDGVHEPTIRQALMARGLVALPAPRLIGPDGGETLKPGAMAPMSWQDGSNLPVTYDVQVSLDANAVGTRQDRFDGSRLPEGYSSFGNEPWRVEDGVAQAGEIDHSQSSSLVLPVDVAEPGQLSFRYRVSSEQAFDAFEFLVDGRPTLVSSGEVDWTEHRTPLSAGQHELTWRYRRDATLGAGQNRVWLDDVRIENASLAEWQDVEVTPGGTGQIDAQWRTLDEASQAAKVRVRARLGDVISPWDSSDQDFVIDEPTAVRLSQFEAGGSGAAWVPWGLLALAVLATLAVWRIRHRA